MRRYVLVLLVLFGFYHVSAQSIEWSETGGPFDFNCDVYDSLQNLLSLNVENYDSVLLLPFARAEDGTEVSLERYLSIRLLIVASSDPAQRSNLDDLVADAASVCSGSPQGTQNVSLGSSVTLFNVVVNGNANLRECAGTSCGIAGQASAGDTYGVVSISQDAQGQTWYEIRRDDDDGSAFIASFLVTRGPDVVIDVEEQYYDMNTGCVLVVTSLRGDSDLRFVLSGDGQDSVRADVFRPGETRPLSVAGQALNTFIDTGEVYINQYYNWNVGFPLGTYIVELEYNGAQSRIAWEMDEPGDYMIYVDCP